MGEVADSMLDGSFCQSCGAMIGDAIGFPRDCADCRRNKNKARGIAKPDPLGRKKIKILRHLRDGDRPWASLNSHRERLVINGYIRIDGDAAQITNAGLAALERYEKQEQAARSAVQKVRRVLTPRRLSPLKGFAVK